MIYVILRYKNTCLKVCFLPEQQAYLFFLCSTRMRIQQVKLSCMALIGLYKFSFPDRIAVCIYFQYVNPFPVIANIFGPAIGVFAAGIH